MLMDKLNKSGRTFQSNLIKLFGSALSSSKEDIVRIGNSLFKDAMRERVSDIHFDPLSEGILIRFRIDGILIDTVIVSLELGEQLTRHLKALAGLNPVTPFKPTTGRRTIKFEDFNVDVRLACTPCVFGEKVTLRLLSSQRLVLDLGHLGLREEMEAKLRFWLANSSGLLLICGPTGNGKTTTMYSMIQELKNTNHSIVTLEDPVEYQVEGINQIQIDPMHDLTFSEGVRTVLRLDPDYVVVGEIRDSNSALEALRASGTGRILMSTLHSREAVGAVTALRNWGLEDYKISSVLRIVVAQRLVRLLCPYCRRKRGLNQDEQMWLKSVKKPLIDCTWVPMGCDHCQNLGFRGRTGIFELWILDEEDTTAIQLHASDQDLRKKLLTVKHSFLLDDGLNKVQNGITNIRELQKLFSF